MARDTSSGSLIGLLVCGLELFDLVLPTQRLPRHTAECSDWCGLHPLLQSPLYTPHQRPGGWSAHGWGGGVRPSMSLDWDLPSDLQAHPLQSSLFM